MSQNVWVKSGTVRNGFAEPGATTNATSSWLYKDSPNATYQATVSGTGAVAATVTIQYSNDGVNALATAGGVITLSGTTSSSDGFTTQNAPWKFWRAVISGISGTGAAVQVYSGV